MLLCLTALFAIFGVTWSQPLHMDPMPVGPSNRLTGTPVKQYTIPEVEQLIAETSAGNIFNTMGQPAGPGDEPMTIAQLEGMLQALRLGVTDTNAFNEAEVLTMIDGMDRGLHYSYQGLEVPRSFQYRLSRGQLDDLLNQIKAQEYVTYYIFTIQGMINLATKMLSGCQTVWTMKRRRVTRRLLWIQTVCIGTMRTAEFTETQIREMIDGMNRGLFYDFMGTRVPSSTRDKLSLDQLNQLLDQIRAQGTMRTAEFTETQIRNMIEGMTNRGLHYDYQGNTVSSTAAQRLTVEQLNQLLQQIIAQGNMRTAEFSETQIRSMIEGMTNRGLHYDYQGNTVSSTAAQRLTLRQLNQLLQQIIAQGNTRTAEFTEIQIRNMIDGMTNRGLYYNYQGNIVSSTAAQRLTLRQLNQLLQQIIAQGNMKTAQFTEAQIRNMIDGMTNKGLHYDYQGNTVSSTADQRLTLRQLNQLLQQIIAQGGIKSAEFTEVQIRNMIDGMTNRGLYYNYQGIVVSSTASQRVTLEQLNQLLQQIRAQGKMRTAEFSENQIRHMIDGMNNMGLYYNYQGNIVPSTATQRLTLEQLNQLLQQITAQGTQRTAEFTETKIREMIDGINRGLHYNFQGQQVPQSRAQLTMDQLNDLLNKIIAQGPTNIADMSEADIRRMIARLEKGDTLDVQGLSLEQLNQLLNKITAQGAAEVVFSLADVDAMIDGMTNFGKFYNYKGKEVPSGSTEPTLNIEQLMQFRQQLSSTGVVETAEFTLSDVLRMLAGHRNNIRYNYQGQVAQPSQDYLTYDQLMQLYDQLRGPSDPAVPGEVGPGAAENLLNAMLGGRAMDAINTAGTGGGQPAGNTANTNIGTTALGNTDMTGVGMVDVGAPIDLGSPATGTGMGTGSTGAADGGANIGSSDGAAIDPRVSVTDTGFGSPGIDGGAGVGTDTSAANIGFGTDATGAGSVDAAATLDVGSVMDIGAPSDAGSVGADSSGVVSIDRAGAGAGTGTGRGGIDGSGSVGGPTDTSVGLGSVDKSFDGPVDSGAGVAPVDTGSFGGPVNTGGDVGPVDTGPIGSPVDTGASVGPGDAGVFGGPVDTGASVGPGDAGVFGGSVDTGASVGPGDSGAFSGPVDTGASVGPGDSGVFGGPVDTGASVGPGDVGVFGGPVDTGASVGPGDAGVFDGPVDTGASVGPGDAGIFGGPVDTGASVGPGDAGVFGGPVDTGASVGPVDAGAFGGPVDTDAGFGPVDAGSFGGPKDTSAGVGPVDAGAFGGPIDVGGAGPSDTGAVGSPTDTGAGVVPISVGPVGTGAGIGNAGATDTGVGMGVGDTGAIDPIVIDSGVGTVDVGAGGTGIGDTTGPGISGDSPGMTASVSDSGVGGAGGTASLDFGTGSDPALAINLLDNVLSGRGDAMSSGPGPDLTASSIVDLNPVAADTRSIPTSGTGASGSGASGTIGMSGDKTGSTSGVMAGSRTVSISGPGGAGITGTGSGAIAGGDGQGAASGERTVSISGPGGASATGTMSGSIFGGDGQGGATGGRTVSITGPGRSSASGSNTVSISGGDGRGSATGTRTGSITGPGGATVSGTRTGTISGGDGQGSMTGSISGSVTGPGGSSISGSRTVSIRGSGQGGMSGSGGVGSIGGRGRFPNIDSSNFFTNTGRNNVDIDPAPFAEELFTKDGKFMGAIGEEWRKARLDPAICRQGQCTGPICYLPYARDCKNYVVCQRTAIGTYVAWKMRCAFGSYWRKGSAWTCERVDDLLKAGYTCPNDPCKNNSMQVYPDEDMKYCRSYWKCVEGISEPACCQPGEKFDRETLTCVLDPMETCRRSCPLKRQGCSVPGRTKAAFYDGNCRTYWDCEKGHPHPVCCKSGMYYNAKINDCDADTRGMCSDTCPTDYSARQCGDVIGNRTVTSYPLHDGNCRTFMGCNVKGFEEKSCCKQKHRYDNIRQECVPIEDELDVCNEESCPIGHKEECRFSPVPGDTHKFQDKSINIVFDCAPGTYFDAPICTCNGHELPQICNSKETWVKFDLDNKWAIKNHGGSGSVSPYGDLLKNVTDDGITYGRFHGSDGIIVWPYTQTVFPTVNMQISFQPVPGRGQKQVLVSNCRSSNSADPSFQAVLNPTTGFIEFHASTETDVAKLAVEYDKQGWNTLSVIFDGENVLLMNEDAKGRGPNFKAAAPLQGAILASEKSLRFGPCLEDVPVDDGFTGYMSEVAFSKCLDQNTRQFLARNLATIPQGV